MTSPQRGIVSASHPLAAEAGARMLRAGGNAVDAAAGVQFALAVVEPLASGIGGGGFSLVRLPDGTVTALDFRESAPRAATPDQFLGPDKQPLSFEERCFGGLSVGVPGTVRGHAEAVRRWGRLSLRDALAPAIELAEQGAEASPFLVSRLGPEYQAKLARDPHSAAVYLPGGRALEVGERLQQSTLAQTLRLLSDDGPEVFYRGQVAEAIVKCVRSNGGRLTLEDLSDYRVFERTPLRGRYGDLELVTMPPPGAGFALLQMLGMLEPLQVGRLATLGAARAHLELQAMRLALLDRAAYLGDPDHTSVPLEALLRPSYIQSRQDEISASRLVGEPQAVDLPGSDPSASTVDTPTPGQTTHFVTADCWGGVVSCTSTLEDFWGCGLTVQGYGFLLNNELTDFSTQPGGPNSVRPLARPGSSMVPTLVLRDGTPWLTIGSPGGPTIVTAVAQVLLRVVEDGLSIQEAIDAPRFFASSYPRFTWEDGLPPETIEALRDLGHQPASRPRSIGSVQALLWDEQGERWLGGADRRRHGTVVEVG